MRKLFFSTRKSLARVALLKMQGKSRDEIQRHMERRYGISPSMEHIFGSHFKHAKTKIISKLSVNKIKERIIPGLGNTIRKSRGGNGKKHERGKIQERKILCLESTTRTQQETR
jgi:hypothetical protein